MTEPHQTSQTTHFGFQQVPVEEKASRVGAVFDSVANRYDLMNDLMSCGIHRLWKRFTVEIAGVRAGERVLDVAGGTGDLAQSFAEQVGAQGSVVVADINAAMLTVGRNRLTDHGYVGNIAYVQGDAQHLPFPDNHFHCITIAFGLRNVTHIDWALASMFRVLRPGGRLLVLEFSKPVPFLRPAYDLYSFKVLPVLGNLVVNDPDSYRYLAESIRMHPDQETLKGMMETAGFERCDYFNLTGGITALHRGYKL
ncbi:bifunctional 2-octaprenyl-6-methoxy-1,4-benzoquinol methylase and demethylmenaquinone methyltransferase [Gammaproteobacteria bacterium]